jgi:sirohydrochlorin cobaltochelatase
MTQALILFAHGARDPRWAEPFEAIAASLRKRAPDLAVRLAYLELMAPDLPAAADALVAEGATRIDILPLFLGTGGHVRRDLPPLVQGIGERHPGVDVRLHAAAGEAAPIQAALTDHALLLAAAR